MSHSKSLASLRKPGKNPPLLPGNYYHFYNRGVNRQPIFFCTANWGFFIQKMRHYLQPELITVLAYCLMPNHYHFLVYLLTDDIGNKAMQPFGTSYVKAVNRQQGRVGPLYQGPFKAKHVDNDGYLAHLTRYIHLNPVRAGLVDHPADWPYSSYTDYVGLRNGTLPQTELILSQLPSRTDYQAFVEGDNEPQDLAFRRKLEHYAVFE
jgi:putative transposase